MLRLLLICGAGLLVGAISAQEVTPEAVRQNVLRNRWAAGQESVSSSRQFVVRGAQRTGWLPHVGYSPGVDLVRLERTILPVSAERVKQALLLEFRTKDNWHGRIVLELHPAQVLDETILINSILGSDGWSYVVRLPDAVRRDRVVAALANVLLLEMANRGRSATHVEIPAWLTEGMTRRLMLSNARELILDQPDKAMLGVNFKDLSHSEQKQDSLKAVHQAMRHQSALTIEQLSWPKEDQLTGPQGETFRNSAQFLVEQLLRLEDGPESLRQFVTGLSAHLNWQIAFLKAFQKHFATQRDFEKWWALRVVDFSGRDLSLTWPSDVSWLKLDEIIRSGAQIRSSTNELPLRTQVTLQTIITDWDFLQQEQMLKEKLQQLGLLRGRVSQALVQLVDDYRQFLSAYIAAREKIGLTQGGRGQTGPSLNLLLRDTLKDLDRLEHRRMELLATVQTTEQTPKPSQDGLVNR